MIQKRNALRLAPGGEGKSTTMQNQNSTMDDGVVITLLVHRNIISPTIHTVTPREVTPADIRLANLIALAADAALQKAGVLSNASD